MHTRSTTGTEREPGLSAGASFSGNERARTGALYSSLLGCKALARIAVEFVGEFAFGYNWNIQPIRLASSVSKHQSG
ncbi:hypothetical protein EVAR_93661_1 [Eumeta japonica]|uniref:Uncharacterized protein n=1 Tax=Eumeta variegata TaxID=151549 RepID=A0A4C1TQN4_EUMVA|nr:hypothetical protein EVAR_93661_1 [Eumeta japonica]